MKVSKEELLHIANLSDLKIKDEEIEKYLKDLQGILDYAEIINSINLENIEECVGTNNINMFRKDEIKDFENKEDLLKNVEQQEKNMFKIPKVLN